MEYIKIKPATVGEEIDKRYKANKDTQLAKRVLDITDGDNDLRLKILDMSYINFVSIYG